MYLRQEGRVENESRCDPFRPHRLLPPDPRCYRRHGLLLTVTGNRAKILEEYNGFHSQVTQPREPLPGRDADPLGLLSTDIQAGKEMRPV